ncbi:MAG: hypothetical protein IKL73_01880 [Lachnospiraceae bacterium]|nr:hypothetical protein [Lachnospiraceae bacterium]
MKRNSFKVYDETVVAFMDDFSKNLRSKAGRMYPDLMALSFWCRKANITKLKEKSGLVNNIGRGVVFHITPSNVPINFAFSYFFGLLSGNSNIVRLPSKDYPQVSIICDVINELLKKEEYLSIKKATEFVKYGHNKELTDKYSLEADARIIWGGDTAIDNIRQSPMKAKSIEVVFADRYSMGVISSDAILAASKEEITKLADDFYNDTYLMDQNACSTPHMIFWMGKNICRAKEIFWKAVYESAKKYNLEPIKVVDKYTDLCVEAMKGNMLGMNFERQDNLLYLLQTDKLPDNVTVLRGRFGMFYQKNIENIDEIAPHISEKVQSLLYYGVDKDDLNTFVLDNGLVGIDRIVPFGKSLDMNVYWDGYDIISILSRRIVVE